MFNKDTNKATNCPRAVLEAFSGESKDQGQFIVQYATMRKMQV